MEHKIVWVVKPFTGWRVPKRKIEKTLNKHAKDGWELVSTDPRLHTTILTFRRPKKS